MVGIVRERERKSAHAIEIGEDLVVLLDRQINERDLGHVVTPVARKNPYQPAYSTPGWRRSLRQTPSCSERS